MIVINTGFCSVPILTAHGRRKRGKYCGPLCSRSRVLIDKTIAKIRLGNPGQHKSVGEGVQEIVLHYGPGYRIYFGEHGATLVILLCGSTKNRQGEAIKQAKRYWKDWKKRLKNPEYAIGYLNAILEKNDPDPLLLGLRDVARAYGFTHIAEATGLNRESLYKALSKGRQPRIGTVMDVLSAMGCRIRLEPAKRAFLFLKRQFQIAPKNWALSPVLPAA
jgi:putative addiction module killer protein/probable addiction module antidote protein